MPAPVRRLLSRSAITLCLLATAEVIVPLAQTGDIVLYAADVSAIVGNWQRLRSTTGAGGLKMTSDDRGWASAAVPLAAPADYFEVEFNADANVDYRVWLRLRGAANNKLNDSVWVQFSGAVAETGSPLWRIGTDRALLVNLESCSGCGVFGWGWQGGAWWLTQPTVVRFATAGRQRIRVQTREDGSDVDQIVLSPANYASNAPGRTIEDATIVPRAQSDGLVRQPYLQLVNDNSAVVAWTSRESGAAEVRFAGPAGSMRSAAPETRNFPANQTGMAFDFFQHEARLTGLAPSTLYTYTVTINGAAVTSGTDTFTTAPTVGPGNVRFIAFGDSGTGSAAQRQLAERMTADVFDLAIHTGDVAYGAPDTTGGGSYPQYDAWLFDVYAQWLRLRPFYPVLGNHDDEVATGRAYKDVFILPENGASFAYPDHAERFYSFDYGNVHFVAIDTELAFQEPSRRQAQLAWLEQDLASTAQPWRVVTFHRPPYSAGAHHGSDLEVRKAISPLLEKYGVQLALSGHEHAYERTVPLQEQSSTGSPVTYIVTGGGGAPLYPAGVAPWTAASASVHHYVRVQTTECMLSLEAVAIDGAVFDRTSIDRCSTAPTSPPPALPTPSGSTEVKDIVLYASDVSATAGNWARLPSSSGAGGEKMASADRGWASPDAALSAPSDFFEASFDAPAGAYRLWVRLRGGGDSKYNESVWVQFSDASDAQGAALWRIGTTQALLVNLEDCGGCGVDLWGWQDNAWWLDQSSVVGLAAAGRHTIRVQTREDGVEIDQIVLSPQRFFVTAPGPVRGDQTILGR
ncbi:MAG: metallophosphoesterase family protein [Vicinamibacterales bacterium]